MKKLLAGVLLLFLVGCTGPEGPLGPTGPQGPAGTGNIFEYTFPLTPDIVEGVFMNLECPAIHLDESTVTCYIDFGNGVYSSALPSAWSEGDGTSTFWYYYLREGKLDVAFDNNGTTVPKARTIQVRVVNP